jgi:hypothetical protein
MEDRPLQGLQRQDVVMVLKKTRFGGFFFACQKVRPLPLTGFPSRGAIVAMPQSPPPLHLWCRAGCPEKSWGGALCRLAEKNQLRPLASIE